MIVTKEISLKDFEGWGGAEDVIDNLIEKGLIDEAEVMIEDYFGGKVDETELNDLLRFEPEVVYEWLDLTSDGEFFEDEEDDKEDED